MVSPYESWLPYGCSMASLCHSQAVLRLIPREVAEEHRDDAVHPFAGDLYRER